MMSKPMRNLALAEEAGPKLRGHEQAIWLPRLEAELGNLRAALSWCVGHGEGQRIARMAWASWTYWGLSGRMSEGRRWTEAALKSEPGMPDASRARLLHIAATLGAAHGDFGSARPANEESMRLFRRLQQLAMTLTHHVTSLLDVSCSTRPSPSRVALPG